MSRKHTHAYAAFQRGKGLVGFLAGLVLATMIIIAVLLMLNSNSKTAIREPSLTQQPQQPETLMPKGSENAQIAASEPQTVAEIGTGNVAASAESASPVMVAGNTEPTQPETTEQSDGNVMQPIDDPDIDKQPITDVKPIDNEPVDISTTVPPVVSKPPRVRDENNSRPPRSSVGADGVPHEVRPKGNTTIGSNTKTQTQTPNRNTTPPRTSSGSGSLKNNDLNIEGVDTPVRKQPAKPPVVSKQPAEPKKSEPSKTTANNNNNNNKDTKSTSNNNKPATTKKPADVKPTPQQILDAGNIEKARELARKQQTTAKPQAAPAPAAKRAATGAVVIQAGAYSSRGAAESQRARLALLGVQARVVEANVNGKPTFRVQTARLEGGQANNTRSLLQRNGVSTLERSAD